MYDGRDPDLNLDALLDSSISEFERGAWERYETPEEGKKVTQLARRIVELMEETVAELSDAKYAEMWRTIHDSLERTGLKEDVKFALQVSLARKVVDTEGMSRRCFELLKIVAEASPPEQVLRFLRRTSRCYILGLAPECLVMCRASFENALNARYASERTSYPADDSGRQSMKARVEGAIAKRWLMAGTGTRSLQVVWGRGNKAAHADPDAVGNALEAIELTMKAIEELHAPSGGLDI